MQDMVCGMYEGIGKCITTLLKTTLQRHQSNKPYESQKSIDYVFGEKIDGVN